jgi:hypothetical protein
MATSEDTTDTLPVATADSSPPLDSTTALWRIAVYEYERINEAYAVVAREYEAACAEYDGPNTNAAALQRYNAAEAKHDDAAGAIHHARQRLFLTPAPDAAAVLYKLDVLLPYIREVTSEDADKFEALDKDIRRLIGNAA